MELKCTNCGVFFSIEDNLYQGEVVNFCSTDCSVSWLSSRQLEMEGSGEYGGDFVLEEIKNVKHNKPKTMERKTRPEKKSKKKRRK